MLNEREITQPLASPLDGWKRPRKLVEKKGRDERIDRLVAYFEQVIEGALNGSKRDNRNACSTLLSRFAKDEKFKQHDPERLVELLIHAGRSLDFHAPKTRSFMYLVRYGGTIIEERQRAKGKRTGQLTDGEYSDAVDRAIAARFGGQAEQSP